MSNKRELVKQFIVDDRVKKVVVQRKPNTVAFASFGGKTGVGFAKVCYPDRWDKDFGKNLATVKACRELADILIKEYGI